MFEGFKKIKVIELATVLAGPLVGTFFSELGATVIKIENLTSGGDPTRQWREAKEEEIGISAYYASANYNKTSVFLDLKNEIDYDRLISMMSDTDIIISNYRPKTAETLKVDYKSLSKVKHNLIYAQLFAFDKMNERPGYDIIMQAECGFLSMSGSKDQFSKMPVALIDVIAAHQMKEAILIALLKKTISPDIPQYIEVSLYQSAISCLANQASNYLMNNSIPQRMGTCHPNIAPYGDIFVTKDGKSIILAIGSDQQFEKLVETLNASPKEFFKFMTNKERVSGREGLNELLQNKIKTFLSDDLAEFFRRKRIPHCFIQDMQEVFSHPLAKEMIRSEDVESRKAIGVRTVAFKLS
jgi:crotonobetainyl-CoA:carnitine CoA-transferase CaiB-like acyl-CoA transferase